MQTLEQWLSVATRGLCDSAAAQVRAEINDHYLSSLEAEVAGDAGSKEVERRAVAALGNAKTANREYRRVLLTKWEDRRLRGNSCPCSSKRRICWSQVFLFLMFLTPLVLISRSIPGYFYIPAALVLEFLLRRVTVSSIRAGRAMRAVRWGILAVGYTIALANGPGLRGGWGFLAGVWLYERHRSVLRRKVPVDQWPKWLYS